jgi:hypothetical protein
MLDTNEPEETLNGVRRSAVSLTAEYSLNPEFNGKAATCPLLMFAQRN